MPGVKTGISDAAGEGCPFDQRRGRLPQPSFGLLLLLLVKGFELWPEERQGLAWVAA